MHWAWQRLLLHVCVCVCVLRRVVNKRQIKCHYVLRAVTMANLSLSLTLVHFAAITRFPSRYAVAHCSYATLHSRDRATEQPDNLLAYSMQIEEQISWPYVEPLAG